MISEQEQRLSPTQFKTAQTGILPRLAWYLALTEHGASSEEALKQIWEDLIGSVGAKKRFASFCGSIPGGFSLFRKIFYQALQSDLWDNQFYQNDSQGLCFHTTRCLYKDLADYYHCPEVAVLFCKVDHVMFDNLKHIRFERSQTFQDVSRQQILPPGNVLAFLVFNLFGCQVSPSFHPAAIRLASRNSR